MLVQSGAANAAEKLRALEPELVIAGLSHHIAVFDHAAVSSYTTLDGEHVPGRAILQDGFTCELGGYHIEGERTPAWDAILDLLACLEAEGADDFHRIMRGCVRASNGPREQDGCHDLLDDRAQDAFDAARLREARREQRGYVTPAQAAAFLRAARDLRLDADRPTLDASARAYIRALSMASVNANTSHDDAVPLVESGSETQTQSESAAAAGFVQVLDDAGLLGTRPRALLGGAGSPSGGLSFVRAHAASHPGSGEELAYLVNALLAGATVQGRQFTLREASECAAHISNLGLENWPPHWSDPDLITAFLVGRAILHRDVCMYAGARLIEAIERISCAERDIQLRLDGLRRALVRHFAHDEPWRVGEALDVILSLDAPAWAALRALIDECPVLHAALRPSRRGCRTIDPADFDFIAENSQIVTVREFLATLGSRLTC